MAVEISLEQMAGTPEALGSSDFTGVFSGPTASIVNPSNVYELSQSESLTFLYNLLYDDESLLTKTDILVMLSSLKDRETSLPFAYTEPSPHLNVQGVAWGARLRQKFYEDRARVAGFSWFTNVPHSREQALQVS